MDTAASAIHKLRCHPERSELGEPSREPALSAVEGDPLSRLVAA